MVWNAFPVELMDFNPPELHVIERCVINRILHCAETPGDRVRARVCVYFVNNFFDFNYVNFVNYGFVQK